MSKQTKLIQADRGPEQEASEQQVIAIHLINKTGLEAFTKGLSGPQRAVLKAQKFTAGGYEYAIVPDGESWFVVSGVANPDNFSSWCLAKLASVLPAGTYRLAKGQPGPAMHGWITGQYAFTRYVDASDTEGPRILLTKEVGKIDAAIAEAEAVNLTCDLVNTPAEDMGPAALEEVAEGIAKKHGATIKVTRGDELDQEFPMVHAVGRAAERKHAPRMIEIEWGNDAHPRIALIGKGVTFDSGGLDLKPPAGMKLMKKDMGGAAHILALADLVMGAGLKVKLHMLVPAVENAVAGNAFRPGDVLKSRKGITVEIGNTDAEGRLVLADALTLASEKQAELVIDFATLTGAARVAVGPDLPALFTREDKTADELTQAGRDNDDLPWRLPLWPFYADWLKSDIADTNNVHNNSFAGASIAALFLDKFVGDNADGEPIEWAHFDTFAWRPIAKPGRPKGGGALGLRAAFHMLKNRYGC